MKAIKPTVHGNVVILDKSDYEEMEEIYSKHLKSHIESRIAESRKQIKQGKTSTNDEVFARLAAKYGN
jgi:PHD/YefM family antitoxin component YafN of YafNO toxin-antitoxin module